MFVPKNVNENNEVQKPKHKGHLKKTKSISLR